MIDLPPLPKLWLPPKPAIVRAASLKEVKATFPFPFAVPRQGGNDANTILLCHCNGANGSTTLTDASTTGATLTAVSPATVSTTQAKFGTASLNPGGTSGFLRLTNSAAFNNLTALTVEFFGYNATPHFSTSAGTNFIFLAWLGNAVYSSSNGSSWNVLLGYAPGFTSPANTWTHYALVWDGTTLFAFQGGVLLGSTAMSLAMGTTGNWSFGQASTIYDTATSFYDEIRLSKVARWTSGFTPPTAAYF